MPLRSAAAGLAMALLLAACDGGVALLSERDRYTGPIRVEQKIGESLRVLDGELEFERSPASLRFVTVIGEQSHELRHGASGLTKTVSGRGAPVSAGDEADFGLLLELLHAEPGEGARVERHRAGYEIRVGDRIVSVRLGG